MTNEDLSTLRQTFRAIRAFLEAAPEYGFYDAGGAKLDTITFGVGGFDCALKMAVDSWRVRMSGEILKPLTREGVAALSEEKLDRTIDDFIDDLRAMGHVVEEQAA